MKKHSIWFWIYWIVWCAYAVPTVIKAIPTDRVYPGALIGTILGVGFVGFVGYIILKWIYDYLTRHKK